MSQLGHASYRLENRALLGVGLMILGLALYPLADAFVKHLMGTYSVYQSTFLRALGRLIPLFLATFFQGGPKQILSTQHPGRHAVRLLVNLCYTYAFMFAYKCGTLTVVYTVGYTSPFFMILLSALLLKERIGPARWIAVAIGMTGILVAMNPRSNVFEMAAVLALIGTFLGALNKILMRRLAATEHSLSIALYPNIVMILCTLPAFYFIPWKAMPLEHWGLFAIVGVLTAIGQYAIAQSLRFAQASMLAPIDYSTFFWVVGLDFFWWDKSPATATLLGALVIVSSNLFILYCARREQVKKAAKNQTLVN